MDFTEQRTICEYNFVFTLWKFPKLYGKFINKINKIENFFSNKDANFYYVLGLQLFKRGFKTFDELTVLTMVNSNALLLDAYNKKGGYDIFLTASKNLVEENVDGYFNEILKLNTLSVLQDNGINIEKDYEKITKMDLDQLKMFYNYKISNVFLTTASETKIQSLDITDDDIAYFNAGSSMGLSIAQLAPLLNYEILGINKGITFIGGGVNTGKTSLTLAVIVMSWILNNVKCCIISNEQTIIEFKQFLMAMASYRLFGEDNNSLTKRRIKIGSYNVDEIEKLTQIKNYVNEHFAPYLSFAKIFDYNINEVQMIVETMSVKGYSGFVYDVFKAEDRTNGRVVDEMIEMSKCLFKSADHTDTSIVATLQLGLTYNNVRYLNMNCISSSKQVAEVASEIILIRTMWDDEVTGAEHDIKIFNYIYDKYGQKMLDAEGNPLTKEIPVNGNEYKNIKLAFIAKTRNTGEFKVIAYHFNGDYNKWVELGYCNPHFTNRENKK